MAYTKVPSTWLGAGATLSSHVIGFNTNDASSNKTLTQLTDADANMTTGDIRVIYYALCEKMFQSWVTQSGSQPAKMTIRRAVTQDSGANIRETYILDFIVTPGTPSTLASE